MLRTYLLLLLFSLPIVAMDRNSETSKIIERHIEITENHEDRIRNLEATVNVLQRREVQRLENELSQQRLPQPRESHLTNLFVLGARAAVTFTVRESLLCAYKKAMPAVPINKSHLRGIFDHMADSLSWGIGYKTASSLTIPNLRWASQKTGIQKLIECTYQKNPLKNFSLYALLLTTRNWLTTSPITCLHATPVKSETIEKLKVPTQSKLTPRKPINIELLMPLAVVSPQMMALSNRSYTAITVPDPLNSMPPSHVLSLTHQEL